MTLAWLAGTSIVWGAVILMAGLGLQRLADLSGRARQWMWRGAAALLIAPWLAAPLIDALNLGLAPAPQALPEMASYEPAYVVSAPMELVTAPQPWWQMIGFPAINWEQALFLALSAGWIIRFVAAQLAARQLGGIVATSLPAEPGAARASLRNWARKLKLRREPDLRIVETGVSPFSFGVLKPVVCLPHDVERGLDAESLDLVVGHECLHVARGDGWQRPVERIVADVFWFNPFAWRIRRELDIARELACDEGMVELTRARKAYARTLRDVAGLAAGLSYAAPATSMSLAGGGRSLMMRMTRTLASARRRPARATLMVGAVLGLIGAPAAVGQVMLATPHRAAPVKVETVLKQASITQTATSVKFEENERQLPATAANPATPAVAATEAAAPTKAKYEQNAPPAPPAPPSPPTQPAPAAPPALAAPKPMPAPMAPPAPGNAPQGFAPIAPPPPANLPNLSNLPNVPELAPPAPPAPLAFSANGLTITPGTGFQIEKDGVVKAAFPGVVKTIDTHSDGTANIKIAQTGPFPADAKMSGENCVFDYGGLRKLRVKQGDKVKPGDEIGEQSGSNAVALSCTSMRVARSSGAAAPRALAIAPGALAITPRALTIAPGALAVTPEALHGAVKALEAPKAIRLQDVPAIRPNPPPKIAISAPAAVVDAGGRITMSFGYVKDPFSGNTAWHDGVDVAKPFGSEIHAPFTGKVAFAGFKDKFGNVVEIAGGDATMRFAHVQDIKVAVGDAVKAGDVIATVGSTGRSTGAHVHVEVVKNGHTYNPEQVEGLTLVAPN